MCENLCVAQGDDAQSVRSSTLLRAEVAKSLCSTLLVAYLWGHALALAITDPRKKGVGWQTVGLGDDGARARDARRVALGDIARRAARVTAFLTNGPPVLDREYHRALRWWEGRRHCYLYLRSVGPLSDGSGDPELDVREAVL
jgi:hypothetical protein